jgi:hypothetical protein
MRHLLVRNKGRPDEGDGKMKNIARYLAIGVVASTLMTVAPAANAGGWSFGFSSGPGYYPSYYIGYGHGHRHHHGSYVGVYVPPPYYGPYYGPYYSPYYGPAWGGVSFRYHHR